MAAFILVFWWRCIPSTQGMPVTNRMNVVGMIKIHRSYYLGTQFISNIGASTGITQIICPKQVLLLCFTMKAGLLFFVPSSLLLTVLLLSSSKKFYLWTTTATNVIIEFDWFLLKLSIIITSPTSALEKKVRRFHRAIRWKGKANPQQGTWRIDSHTYQGSGGGQGGSCSIFGCSLRSWH